MIGKLKSTDGSVNMKIRQILFGLVLISLLSLTGCLSAMPPAGQQAADFDMGRQDFLSGDYYQAFRHLEPSARGGVAEAQYAVGYMYYYGLGTTQDRGQALQWMQAAASQGHPQAREALVEIREHAYEGIQPFPNNQGYQPAAVKIKEPRQQANNPEYDTESNSATRLRASWPPPKGEMPEEPMPVEQMPEPPVNMPETSSDSDPAMVQSYNRIDAPVTPVAPKVFLSDNEDYNNDAIPHPGASSNTHNRDKPELRSPSPTVQAAAEAYTVQILASYDQQSLETFIQENNLENKVTTYQVNRDGRNWYVLGYGHYENKKEAQRAAQNLPSNLQQASPWVRNTVELNNAAYMDNIG